ncbi:hypothetical protein [Maribacter arcticus]|uniref:Uncharacterized protein n=1 Tax=Maribacter arcticus TaxID=561365 RepID=A0A1T5ECG5_9FLAO|nr:hypothetical protein [Maribacter arcticus]SKB81583.1 hypothetical protein SAMN05660866_03415 [Maribacter arcticus]
MKKIDIILIVFIALFWGCGDGVSKHNISDNFENSIQTSEYYDDDITYKIALNKKITVDSLKSLDNIVLELQVFVNNKPVKIDEQNKIEISGCSYLDFPEIIISVVTFKDKLAIGWRIDGLGSVCGNTYSSKTYLVLPQKHSTCFLYSLASKGEPLIEVRSANSIEILSYYQEWGRTGTASSFFVPMKTILKIDSNFSKPVEIEKGDLLIEIEKLDNEICESYLKGSYLGLFTAALNDRNAELLEYAFINFFDENDASWYNSQGIVYTPNEISDLKRVLVNNQKLPDRFKHLLRH